MCLNKMTCRELLHYTVLHTKTNLLNFDSSTSIAFSPCITKYLFGNSNVICIDFDNFVNYYF